MPREPPLLDEADAPVQGDRRLVVRVDREDELLDAGAGRPARSPRPSAGGRSRAPARRPRPRSTGRRRDGSPGAVRAARSRDRRAGPLRTPRCRSREGTAGGTAGGMHAGACAPPRCGRTVPPRRLPSRTRGTPGRRSASPAGSRACRPPSAQPSSFASASRSIDSGAETPTRSRSVAEDLLRRPRKPEPRLRERGIVGDHAALGVEPVERRREVLGGVREPMRSAVLRRGRDQAWDVGERAHEVLFGLGDEEAEVRIVHRAELHALLRMPSAGSTRSAHARTGRSRPGSRGSAARPRRCRSSSADRSRTGAGGTGPRRHRPHRSVRPARRTCRRACSSSPVPRRAGTTRTGTGRSPRGRRRSRARWPPPSPARRHRDGRRPRRRSGGRSRARTCRGRRRCRRRSTCASRRSGSRRGPCRRRTPWSGTTSPLRRRRRRPTRGAARSPARSRRARRGTPRGRTCRRPRRTARG